MPIHDAVLALLAQGSSYGYELKSSFEEAIGPQWGEINIGHLYQVLDRLVRDGLVSERIVAQTDRPDRRVFRLTASGRQELERWLETPFVRASGYRDDFFLKLFAASRLGTDAVRTVVQTQRRAYLGELGWPGDDPIPPAGTVAREGGRADEGGGLENPVLQFRAGVAFIGRRWRRCFSIHQQGDGEDAYTT